MTQKGGSSTARYEVGRLSVADRKTVVAEISAQAKTAYEGDVWQQRIAAPLHTLILRYELTLRLTEIAATKPWSRSLRCQEGK